VKFGIKKLKAIFLLESGVKLCMAGFSKDS
jgi:hypothetical protein